MATVGVNGLNPSLTYLLTYLRLPLLISFTDTRYIVRDSADVLSDVNCDSRQVAVPISCLCDHTLHAIRTTEQFSRLSLWPASIVRDMRLSRLYDISVVAVGVSTPSKSFQSVACTSSHI